MRDAHQTWNEFKMFRIILKKQITEMNRVVADLSFHCPIISTIDVQKQFTGFNRGKAGPAKNGHNSHSDEEKKKKNLKQKRKNGRKKGKIIISSS